MSIMNETQQRQYRCGNIEIMRFIACIIIMTFHVSYIGIDRGVLPFSESYIFVEFFFALTGYFTIVHFDKYREISLDQKAYAAIKYTIEKLKSFYPYVFISVTLCYLVNYSPIINRYEFEDIVRYFFDVTLLTGCFNNQKCLNGALWYLSALLIVYPAFSLLCQMKSKYIFYILSFYIPLIYYGYCDEIEYTRFPINAVRAMVGLFLGGLIYALANKIKKWKLSDLNKYLLTIAEVIIMLLIVFLSFRNQESYRFYLICFVLGLGIMLSQKSLTSRIKGGVFDFLGKISMVIYIFHPAVGSIVQFFYPDYPASLKLVLYYAFTFIFSTLIYLVVEKVKIVLKSKRYI